MPKSYAKAVTGPTPPVYDQIVHVLPNGAAQFAPDGFLVVTQTQPIPAIRRVDLATGRITTVVRGD